MHREIAMEEEIISLASKSYMRHLVAQTNEYPSFYKYCDFDGGIAMLSAMNIQFTRADSLNDDDEVNISKCNIEAHIQLLRDAGIPEDIISKKFDEAQSFFSGIGICSCGKTAHNDKLWKDYASKNDCEDGMCIELNQDLVISHLLANNIVVMSLVVHYFDNVSNVLPWDLFLGNDLEKKIFFQLLYTSKLRSIWAEEDEVRFIYSEPFVGIHYRPLLSPKCIKAVYYGRDMTQTQRVQIGQILNRYRHIKRIMRH